MEEINILDYNYKDGLLNPLFPLLKHICNLKIVESKISVETISPYNQILIFEEQYVQYGYLYLILTGHTFTVWHLYSTIGHQSKHNRQARSALESTLAVS